MKVPTKTMTEAESREWWMEIFNRNQRNKEEKENELAALRPVLLESLRAMALINLIESPIQVKYEGYGDSGGIEEKPENLPQEVEDYLWEILWNRERGFENNDGGYGFIEWDLTNDVITINHFEYVTETVERDYEV